MELRQLQHFLAVAEERHFTRAARRVNIVQSALSTSVRLLEEELGARLFVRTTRQVRLTAAGEVLVGKARDLLAAARDAREAVAAVQGMTRGTLRIGTVQSLPAFLDLPSLLARFHAQHPRIEVRLSQSSATALLDQVRTGRLDLAFLPVGEPPEDLHTALIACEAMVVACAPDHLLAGRRDVPLASLRGELFVDFAPEWGTRKLVDRGFLAAGVERHIGFEVSDLGTLLDLVGRGLGVALLPEALVRARVPALGVAELAGPELCWELVVAYAAGEDAQPADQAPRAFLALLDGANDAAHEAGESLPQALIRGRGATAPAAAADGGTATTAR
ncbi:MAG TPA: LysR substrate-binding domain-containing protein [Acetobacteraceae bacterium]|jgi:DNA-binding transcriptional LysR family regulator